MSKSDHPPHAHAGHHHDHSHVPANFDLAFGVGVVLNIGFVAIEATYRVLANSLALLADARHNLSDVAVPAHADRTYGFGPPSALV
jgi:cobalt-zinc-cadmium efflux system protein